MDDVEVKHMRVDGHFPTVLVEHGRFPIGAGLLADEVVNNALCGGGLDV